MRFIEAKDALPEHKHTHKYLKKYFEGFMSSNIKIATVEFSENEYKNVTSCQASLRKSIKRFGFPIKATVRNGMVYLIRLDI